MNNNNDGVKLDGRIAYYVGIKFEKMVTDLQKQQWLAAKEEVKTRAAADNQQQ